MTEFYSSGQSTKTYSQRTCAKRELYFGNKVGKVSLFLRGINPLPSGICLLAVEFTCIKVQIALRTRALRGCFCGRSTDMFSSSKEDTETTECYSSISVQTSSQRSGLINTSVQPYPAEARHWFFRYKKFNYRLITTSPSKEFN